MVPMFMWGFLRRISRREQPLGRRRTRVRTKVDSCLRAAAQQTIASSRLWQADEDLGCSREPAAQLVARTYQTRGCGARRPWPVRYLPADATRGQHRRPTCFSTVSEGNFAPKVMMLSAWPRQSSLRRACTLVVILRQVRSLSSSEGRTIILVRHGAVDRTKSGVPPGALYGGDIDVPLSLRGEAEARAAARYVVERFDVSSVWASPLARAVFGAQCIADAAGVESVETSEALREIARGGWLRKTPDEIEAMTPGGMDAFLRDTAYRPPGGAESIDDVRLRATEALIQRVLPTVEPAGAAVVVSHLYVTRALLSSALPDTPIPDIDVPTASVSGLVYDDNGMATVLFRGVKPALSPEDEARLGAGDAES